MPQAQATTSLRPVAPPARDWYVQEWLLLFFAMGMLVFLYLVAQHEARLQKSEIVRDAAVIEQSIARQLEAQQSFFDRLALDLGARRLSLQQFDDVAGKRAIESNIISEVLLVNAEMNVIRHTPATLALESVLLTRAPFSEQARIHAFTQKTMRGTYSDPYSALNGRWFIEYATPIFEEQRFAGTVNLLISLDNLLDASLGPALTQSYRALLSTATGDDISQRDPAAIGDGGLSHTILLSVPWRDMRLTLYGSNPSSLLPNLTLSVAVVALTALMVWTVMSLRTQQRMRREAEAERDRVFRESLASLRQANERFETVLDSLDVAVYVSDLETHEILFCNTRFRETFPGHGVGARIHDIERGFAVDPTEKFPAERLAPGGVASQAVYFDEVEHRASQRWFLMRTRAVNWVDGRVARLTTLGDVTDRVVAERLRKTQEEKLTRTSRLMTVGEMASTLAHEINQPLGAIANYINGCLRRLRMVGGADEQVLRAMEKADAQVRRAGAIISRVREFVRTREPERRPVDINALVVSVSKLMNSDEAERALTCRLELDPTLRDAFADQIMIEQVLLNLLRNAREAMSHLPQAERVVVVRTRRLDDNQIEVEVADRGTGIPEDAEQQLFSPFFSTKSEGMGMGLNICRSLIEYHEGNLTFVRNADVGTTFRFTLPFAEDPP
jgi:signal transduction histidine kinase